MSTLFHPLTVTKIEQNTRDSIVVTLIPEDSHEDTFTYLQGQHLTLRAMVNNQEMRRSYSICSGVQEQQLRIAIKQIADGAFSNWAAENLKVGYQIDSLVPTGNFRIELDSTARNRYVAFVVGSGITPILSIIKSTLKEEPHSQFTLFYGNRFSSSIMFREEIEDLKNKYLQRLQVIHILSREKQDIAMFNGKLDKQKCLHLLKYWFGERPVSYAFLCGPQTMMAQTEEALKEFGVKAHNIKYELFANPLQQMSSIREQLSNKDYNEHTLLLTIDGRQHQLQMGTGQQSVLDTAIMNGIEVPYACKAGVCSSCKAMLVDGNVEMDANFALEDYEIERGYVLTCQSYAISSTLSIDYDQ